MRYAAALALALVACTPESASPVEFPGGADGYSLVCRSVEECMRDAREACGGGFVVRGSNSGDVDVAETRGHATRLGGATFSESRTTVRQVHQVRMLVRCRR